MTTHADIMAAYDRMVAAHRQQEKAMDLIDQMNDEASAERAFDRHRQECAGCPTCDPPDDPPLSMLDDEPLA